MVMEIIDMVHRVLTKEPEEVLSFLEEVVILVHGTIIEHLEAHQDTLADLQQDHVLEDSENKHFVVH